MSSRRATNHLVLTTAALLLTSPVAADYVVFHGGRYMRVEKWQFVGNQTQVELAGGASMSFPSHRVRYIAPDRDVEVASPEPAAVADVATDSEASAPSEPWLRYADERFAPSIRRVSAAHDVDPALVAAVVRIESDFRPGAVSPKGAQGLMQLMPATARELEVDDPFDPDANLAGGARYLRALLKRYEGSVELALAAYNAGPKAVDRAGGIPPYRETRRYVGKVMALWLPASSSS